MEELTKFQKMFYITYTHQHKDNKGNYYPSGILFLIDLIFLPINYPTLLLTKWKKRLL